MVDQNLGLAVILPDGEILAQKPRRAYLIPPRRGGGVNAVKMLHQKIIVRQLLHHIGRPGHRPGGNPHQRRPCRHGSRARLPLGQRLRPARVLVRAVVSRLTGRCTAVLCFAVLRLSFPRFLVAIPGQVLVFLVKCFHRLILPVGRVRIAGLPSVSGAPTRSPAPRPGLMPHIIHQPPAAGFHSAPAGVPVQIFRRRPGSPTCQQKDQNQPGTGRKPPDTSRQTSSPHNASRPFTRRFLRSTALL